MSDTYIDHEAAKATIRTANAVERIATLLEGRESGVRVAQLDQIRQIHDQWMRCARPEVVSEDFMQRISDVLRGDAG